MRVRRSPTRSIAPRRSASPAEGLPDPAAVAAARARATADPVASIKSDVAARLSPRPDARARRKVAATPAQPVSAAARPPNRPLLLGSGCAAGARGLIRPAGCGSPWRSCQDDRWRGSGGTGESR
jgi:hypothetical protein